MFGVQRSSVKLVDRTLHSRSANGARHTGEIIAKAALGEGGLDPSVRRAVSRRTRPFPEPAPRRGWLAEREAEAPLLSDLQTSPSEAQCAHPGNSNASWCVRGSLLLTCRKMAVVCSIVFTFHPSKPIRAH